MTSYNKYTYSNTHNNSRRCTEILPELDNAIAAETQRESIIESTSAELSSDNSA